MAIEFKLPDIGEGLADGEIIKWLVSEGDHVEEDQPLVEVLTDKATVEIPSPHDGRILELCAGEGDVVAIGATILLFAASDEESAEGLDEQPSQVPDDIEMARDLARAERSAVEAELAEDEAVEDEVVEDEVVEDEVVEDEAVEDELPMAMPAAVDGRILATPATRRLANEMGIDIAQVAGSGMDGRVMKEDVRAFAEGGPPAVGVPLVEEVEESQPEELTPEAPVAIPTPPAVVEPPARIEPPARVEPSAPPAGAPLGPEERIPLRGLRRKISERMVVAKQRAPHYTYVEEADMEEVVQLRAEAKGLAAEHGVKLTYLPFIVRALTMALKKHPYLNASLDEEAGEIVLKRYYNIGIAAATEGGLIVPVIKNADALGLFELAAEIQRISGAARDGKITLEDLQGGTFTITSTGNIGGLIATPILNLPEVAILGVTAIRKRPVVRNDQIVIRHMVNLSLTLDHRVVDGAVGALFMRDLVKLLEDPKLQLLANL